jgi:hypothetical protein
MRSSTLVQILAAGLLWVASGAAQEADDPAAAHEQLKEGFALRKAGQCAAALPHFVESFRLARQPKALLNMADCEERLEHFIDAEEHWRQARDLAQAQGSAALTQEAGDRFEELAPRIPHLTITLASGAPPSSHVLCDGVGVGAASLGVPLPYDVGRHTLEVRADGYETKVFEVALGERDGTRVDVEPGPRLPPAELPLAQPAMPSVASPSRTTPGGESAHPGFGAPFTVGIGAGALAVASFTFATIEGLTANRDHTNAVHSCQPTCGSSPLAESYQDSAYGDATLANVGFVAGGVLALTSLALLVIPRISSPPGARAGSRRPSRAAVVPLMGQRLAGIGIGGLW